MVWRVSATLAPSPVPRASAPTAPRRRTRLLALPEARWALASTVAFLLAFPLDLAGASAWLYGPLYAVAYAAGGWEPALEGLRALREKSLDVDLLMIVAALGAAAIGQVLDGGLLIVIFATSGALEALATARTADSVRGLLDLAPTTATRLPADGSAEETVPTDRLAVGDVVLVRPGERVGADGRVLEGESEADQATITGEPLPVPKAPGDEVFAGTLNGTGALRVRVERDPADSVIARIVTLVEEASRTKAPTQLFIEKVEQRYAVGIVVATLAVFAVPLALGEDLTAALLRAMTFMIVASPCAVVLATMPPLLSAIANAGRHGVLVKSAVAMERLGEIDVAALDKTGTLTEGTPEITAVRPLPGSGLDEDGLLALAAAAEHPSEHPLARAVVAAAGARGLRLAAAEDFAALPGRGVRARVGGRAVTVGRPGEGEGALDGESAEGTTVVVTRDGEAVGTLTLNDRPRSDAPGAVAALTALTGGSPVLLTGDNARAAARVAADTGIADVRAGLLPQDKVAAVRELQDGGRKVLFVGDGVNDAPALAAAHSGVAMGRAGSDLALETADAVVVRDELSAIPAVVRLSRAARRLVVQNLVIAGVCIAVLVVWDLAGHLPLPLGVAGHEGSTVLVGLNGLRLLRESAWRRATRA
ncbi:heavy metal translocating P-type ATPase [Streptomyces scabiei]|uniref:heavy metal translocating P-type ATPase n=6 Tax=Streptomyces scabiei TaxID=1930 RepID=UPI001B3074DA|nr:MULTISPECIES: heavy metal translocating P-type ATPase [Streptomyces]MDW8476904.1 heavy metal translocating P-type ATPase [Streptomyces scabiei]MDX2569628.1 heavy metal translocating P-type ATPase [Streptomyces scabiei]MDX3167613.1 heavy metal translocating P-type ATPase [Streptomyces scabiei]MDX3253395.1 heavy metal translocating P-type ATPase [Streptomyces scabiei]MDX3288439.1 heavy metal translocating P-type ATPase [Streptomyces scabiei]